MHSLNDQTVGRDRFLERSYAQDVVRRSAAFELGEMEEDRNAGT
nr:hypothetical protein [uncultured Dyadobacter sp.]